MVEPDYNDMSKWDEGPWTNEPKEAVWTDEATGLRCAMVRGPMGAWNGYVGVDELHPVWGMSYDGIPQEDADERRDRYRAAMRKFPLGGDHDKNTKQIIAMSKWCDENSPSGEPYPGIGDKIIGLNVHGGVTYSGLGEFLPLAEPLWWLGFDTGHCYDFSPGMFFAMRHHGPPFQQTIGERDETYRTFEYVQSECRELARQLAEIKVGALALAQQIQGDEDKS